MKKTIQLLVILLLVGCGKEQSNDDLVNPKSDLEIIAPIEKETYSSIFNGGKEDVELGKYQAFGIIISNSKEARPQSGLDLADIVYEVAVETYSITRFIAIFSSNYPTKVGPVRSARIPFVRIAQEWNLPFSHYGAAKAGLGDAKSLIEQIQLPKRFDGVYGINNEYFFRSIDRSAPHNAYFNSEAALSKIPELEYKKHFEFDDKTNISGELVSKLSLRYSAYTPVKYEYDKQTNKYKRFIHDEPMVDAYTNEQISVTNIIVQHAPHTMVESAYYVLVDFLGEGKAEFYINGQYEEGTWKKESFTSATYFFNSKGEPVVLLPGNTWVQVVHPKVNISNN